MRRTLLEARKHVRLARLLDLAREEHLVEHSAHLVEVEHEIQLAHILKVRVEDFDKQVDRLEVCQLVVLCVDARAEVQARIPAIH